MRKMFDDSSTMAVHMHNEIVFLNCFLTHPLQPANEMTTLTSLHFGQHEPRWLNFCISFWNWIQSDIKCLAWASFETARLTKHNLIIAKIEGKISITDILPPIKLQSIIDWSLGQHHCYSGSWISNTNQILAI